jgi:RNA-directed DNA polymerase
MQETPGKEAKSSAMEATISTAVPAKAPQAGKNPDDLERRSRWSWVEATVWTDRMLAALETGVKGGCWFSLIDKVHSTRNLWSAWAKSAKNNGAPGVDGITIDRYEKDAEANVAYLSEQLKAGEYQPKPIRRTHIPKPDGTLRPLGIPTVADRIVQGAVRHAIEPIFEKEFASHSYGFRPGRGCKDALRGVDALLKTGYRYVVDADFKSYFDTIPHDLLMKQDQNAGGRWPGAETDRVFPESKHHGRPQRVDADGRSATRWSPLLSNIYLNPLDHLMAGRGCEMVRYADDFVILCRTKEDAQSALAEVKQWTAQAGLSLHPEKTRLIDTATEGFEFLGYRFHKGRRDPRHKSKLKLRDTIRHKTRRANGDHDQTNQPGAARLVRLLQACLQKRTARGGRMGAHAAAKHPAQTPETPRPGQRCRSSTLAQRLLCRTWTVLAEQSP